MENDPPEEDVRQEPNGKQMEVAGVEQTRSEVGGEGSRAYVRMVESLLMPDANGMVRKDKLVEFFQKTVGSMFNDNKATEVLEDLKCDGDNMIRLECFLKAFAEKYCSEETLAGIVELLGSRPDSLEQSWDWKGMLAGIGLELSDAELREAVLAAKSLAEMLLSQQTARDKDDETKGEILQAVQENLHLMGVGEGAEAKEEEPQGP